MRRFKPGAQCVQWEVKLATTILVIRKLACWSKSGHLEGMNVHGKCVIKQEGVDGYSHCDGQCGRQQGIDLYIVMI
jgi:hypothetical protein